MAGQGKSRVAGVKKMRPDLGLWQLSLSPQGGERGRAPSDQPALFLVLTLGRTSACHLLGSSRPLGSKFADVEEGND